jgi:hypothetical protein
MAGSVSRTVRLIRQRVCNPTHRIDVNLIFRVGEVSSTGAVKPNTDPVLRSPKLSRPEPTPTPCRSNTGGRVMSPLV